MSFAHSANRKRWEFRCDHCKRLLGAGSGLTEAEHAMDPRAGYVTTRGKRQDGRMCGCGSGGCRPIYIHPLACSDECEDELLATWPVVPVGDRCPDDWGPDFRDKDVT